MLPDLDPASFELLDCQQLQLSVTFALPWAEPTETARLKNELPLLWQALPGLFWQQLQAQSPYPALSPGPWQVEVSLIDNPAITELNAQYRQKPQPTDVLSFPVWEEPWLAPALPLLSLGHIAISVPWAETHAPQQNTPLATYLTERLIHGLLHLSGHHHPTQAQFNWVVGFQTHLLGQLGLSQPQGLVKGLVGQEAKP